MNQRNNRTRRIALAAALFTAAWTVDARNPQVQCQGQAKSIAAVTKPAGHVITTPYSDTLTLQPLLSTTIHTEADGCVIASLSGQVRITDNFVVFQVRIDGVPLQGQSPLIGFTTPVVFVAIDASTVNDDEQFIDPTKAVAFNFFGSLPRGSHLVEVLGAGGSAIAAENPPTATHLVLTLVHR
ncbi:hypothetical protein LuPra_02574 [Luteitalea pratensis]|uniref:Uncharacterized protein n=1 Tax=Luteitalea pratensis TaxID=1855912 RepID=A0A143PNL1_LUTPR|nr:hypothetical protein [Luteitalea pratensis]AMY09359.1 hypothetical protein LuPra_02574 [Luteitalea pratensis]